MDTATLQLINDYQTPASAIERLRDVKAVILTGITAAGKNTIINDILADDRFVSVVTSTTRLPRENNGVMEENGVDYHFLTQDEAIEKIHAGEYIEVANVHGKIYGSLVSEYERISGEGKIALSDIDYQGAVNFLDFGMDNLQVLFVVPPSFEVWLARLTNRSGGSLGEDKQEIIRRFRSAEQELSYALSDDRFIPVMNVNSASSADEIVRFVVNGDRPSEESIQNANVVIKELGESISQYIEQLDI